MTSLPWILISVAVLVVVIGILAIIATFKTKRKHKPDYYAFFIMGITWLAIGIPLGTTARNWTFFILGIVFLTIGLANKDKWKTNHEYNKWKNLTKTERIFRVIILVILGLLVLAGLVVFLLVRSGTLNL